MEVGLKVKNLPLDLWCRNIFEAIGDNFGGLIEIGIETLNFTNCSDAHIQVKKNQCGFDQNFIPKEGIYLLTLWRL